MMIKYIYIYIHICQNQYIYKIITEFQFQKLVKQIID